MSPLPLHLEINEWLLNQCPSVVSYFCTGLPVTLHADESSVSLFCFLFVQEKCDVFLPAHFFGWWAKVSSIICMHLY